MKKLLIKYKSWEKLLKKEESILWKWLRDKADKNFSIFIRERDKKRWCITCSWPVQHNAHWIDRWRYSHRWDELNCCWACAWCNCYRQEEHKIKFTIYQTKTHWQDWVDEQIKNRHKIKPSIDDLIQITEKYL